jgi:hypothetical protein
MAFHQGSALLAAASMDPRIRAYLGQQSYQIRYLPIADFDHSLPETEPKKWQPSHLTEFQLRQIL